jgi:DNA-binding transcriptional ArsR family regulator
MEKGHDIRHGGEIVQKKNKGIEAYSEDFVLEKSIFNNVFEKDIRRVFIYKKAERLAKAIHLITPAFSESVSLRNRIDAIAIGLVDAAILPSSAARTKLSSELLALSSILSIAHIGGLLSSMNTELIARETRLLLQEVAAYEEPRLFLDEAPTLSTLAKKVSAHEPVERSLQRHEVQTKKPLKAKGHNPLKDTKPSSIQDRSESILSVIRNKGVASIKDISTVVLDISEKTIQRELAALVAAGALIKEGERRWSTYSLA